MRKVLDEFGARHGCCLTRASDRRTSSAADEAARTCPSSEKRSTPFRPRYLLWVKRTNAPVTAPPNAHTRSCTHPHQRASPVIIRFDPENLSKEDSRGRNILHLSCIHGRRALCHYLVESDAVDVNSTDNDENTPLILLCMKASLLSILEQEEREAMGRILLSKGEFISWESR